MNDYEYNRFKYLTEYTDEELVKEFDEAQDDLDFMNRQVRSGNIKSSQASEFEGSDIPYREDQIKFIKMLIQQRGIDVDAVRGAALVESAGRAR